MSLRAKNINNQIYNQLGERWYTAKDDPIALLRAESRLRNPWILGRIQDHFGSDSNLDILDLACGGGFLSNELAKAQHKVQGVDLSPESLEIARQYDSTGTVQYKKMDANHLAFENESFDVVCAMDFLEHISNREQIFQEVARVLRKNGLFFFHTFNRNFLSYLIVIKGVEWFVKNTPPELHLYSLFLKPREVNSLCKSTGFDLLELKGVRPRIFSRAFWSLLFRGEVEDTFQFEFTPNTLTGYTGIARKR